MVKRIWVVLRKEILDASRDLKGLAPGLLMPIMFALMTYGTVQFLVSMQDQPARFEVAVEGQERAQPLMQALAEAGIFAVPAPANPRNAVKRREVEMVLVVPENFGDQFRAQQRANVDLIWDVTRTDIHGKVSRLKSQVHQWSSTTGSLRLILRGVSPEVSQVISVSDINVASDEKMAVRLFGALPMVILLLTFVAGAGMSSEMAAGERENHTLEPVMINPISAGQLFGGKWLAAVVVTSVLVLIGVLLQVLSVNAAPLEKLGMRAHLGVIDFVIIMLITAPVILLATALQLLVSFLSKSFKDAQSYSQLVMLLPVVPGIYVLMSSTGADLWKMWVPLLGPQLLIVEVFGGQRVAAVAVMVAALTSIIVAVLCAWLAVQLMRRER